MRTKIQFCFWIIFLSICSVSNAQREPVYIDALIGDSIKVGKKIVVKDSSFYDPVLKPTIKRTQFINNLISLRINEEINKVMPDSFGLSVKVKIIYTAPDTLSDSIAEKTLTINYNKNRTYENKSVFYFTSAHYVEVKVLQITSTYADSSVTVPLALLENRMVIQRDYDMSCTNDMINAIVQDTSKIAAFGELKLSWTPNHVSQMYDVEWTYVDQSALDKYSTSGHLDPNKIFRNNATRITTKSDTCMIPLLYDGEGLLVYRIRGIQVDQNGELQTTKWNSDSDTTSAHWKYHFMGHERGLNWQASTTYAEEGKRKSVVQYFDGSLRARQVVTRDNTTQTTVVAETLYDKQGRPVIQVMPAPTLSTLIHYTPLFNVKDMNGAEYDKGVYDTLFSSSDYCDIHEDSMSVTGGASKYYSSQNPLKNEGFHKFIPNAHGYAFTQTQYTQDNTGRVYAQSGVDSGFILGSGKETKYYYFAARQNELDALFGTEVGDESHYQKNMVRDANGQYSVSYVDMHGRTIATALAGRPPATLDALSSFRDEVETQQLLSKTNNIVNGQSVEFSTSIFMTKEDDVLLHYSMAKQGLSLRDCKDNNICYSCLYDLTITVTGDCSNSVSGKTDTTVRLSNFPLWNVDTTCDLAVPIDATINLHLKEGSYNITKSLTISKQGMDKYRDSVYLLRNTCSNYDSIYRREMKIIKDSLSCSVDTLKEATYTRYRDIMMMDVYPLVGQYGHFQDTSSCFSIFRRANNNRYYYQTAADSLCYKDDSGQCDVVVNSLGQSVKPEQLSPEEFIASFKDSWLQTLITVHPEYRRLQQYEKFATSLAYDDDYESTETYASAVAKGYLNPTGSSAPPANNFIGTPGDPLYGYSFASTIAKTAIEDSLFELIPLTSSTYITAWGLATASVKCPTQSNSTCVSSWNTATNVFNSESLCTGELDMAWRTFRGIYLKQKRSWINKYVIENAGVSDGSLCTPIFSSLESLLAQNGFTPYGGQSNQNTGRDSAQAFYVSNCNAYADRWREQLGSCYTDVQKDSIIKYLTQVCVEGADSLHPLGASTVSPISTYQYKNFDQVFTHFNSIWTGIDSSVCNSYRIDKPLPYSQPTFVTKQQIWSKPDTCTCTRINALYNQYRSDSSHYSSFSAFIQVTQGTTLTNAVLDSLRSLCNGAISCNYLSSPISLPPALQCGASSVCINCDQFNQLYNNFQTRFPGITPTMEETDTVAQLRNLIFANYMNQNLGFAKTAQDYLLFKETCSGGSDSLLKRIRDFKDYYYSVNRGQLYKNYKISSAAFAFVEASNAVIQARQYLNGSHLPPGYAISPFTYNFDAKLRSVIRTSLTDSAYETIVPHHLQNSGYIIPELESNIVVDSDFVTGSAFTKDLKYKYWAVNEADRGNCFQCIWSSKNYGAYAYYGVSTPMLKYLPDTACGCRENHFYTFTYFKPTPFITGPSTYTSYFADSVFRGTQNTTFLDYKAPAIATNTIKAIKNLRFAPYVLPLSDMSSFQQSSKGLMVTLEMKNGTETDAFIFNNEDYHPQLHWKEVIDSNLYDLDCHKAFVTYFNQQGGTNYSGSQVDSIYTVNNINPGSICDSAIITGPTLCGKSEAINEIVNLQQHLPCQDSTDFAIMAATQLDQIYQDSLIGNFNEAYTKKCLNVFSLESFTLSKPVSEYHYTLYYYDQAGNLVKTISPEGVHPNRDITWLGEVRTKRINGETQVPSHLLPTTYRYNSLNQVVSQKSPDANLSTFWYDRLGRLVISQNANQQDAGKYSYTKYDAIGRIVEVGEKLQSQGMSQNISRNSAALTTWLNFMNYDGDHQPKMVTLTSYDEASDYKSVYENFTPFRQKAYTLRNRVSRVRLLDPYPQTMSVSGTDTTYTPQSNSFTSAIEYSYDIHGNVDSMLNISGPMWWTIGFNYGGNAFKLITYKYDLISGKVNEVHYQPSNSVRTYADEFYHRYEYDAENRLIDVYTTDNKALLNQPGLEEHDAHYEYYRHGPLARTVLGQQQVQGVDYAYTLQGWLKGVNSSSMNSDYDMGQDGKTTSTNKYVARDEYGFNLNYFTGEYSPINSDVTAFAGHTAFMPTGAYKPLYNGNISSMAVNIRKFAQPQLYNYGYDQLNRITKMDVYRGLNESNNQWANPLTAVGDYKERVSYDANGNILSYVRHGYGSNLPMDSLNYYYLDKTQSNLLEHISDGVSSSAYTNDLKNQGNYNYHYDKIGNIISDGANGISWTAWNVYGKIDRLFTNYSGSNDVYETSFLYDPNGNRIEKSVFYNDIPWNPKKHEWYVRDAQGNVMAVYAVTATGGETVLPPLMLTEQYVYGSSRLGVIRRNQNMDSAKVSPVNANLIGSTYVYNYSRGNKYYELSNHLSNVLVTVSDKRFGHNAGNGTYDYYNADVVNANDYYPFGMMMPGRTYSAQTSYRYGFNGKENDNEVKGEGNQQDYGMRIYDPRIGKFLSVDPLTKNYPELTPYQFASNRPIDGSDLDGKEWKSEIRFVGPTGKYVIDYNITISLGNNTVSGARSQNELKLSNPSDKKILNEIKTRTESILNNSRSASGTKEDPIANFTITFTDKDGPFTASFKDFYTYQTVNTTSKQSKVTGDPFAYGAEKDLGETQTNEIKIAMSNKLVQTIEGVPGSTMRLIDDQNNTDVMAHSLGHELGHTAGLRHPWDSKNNISEINQNNPPLLKDKLDLIKRNLMNSEANPIKSQQSNLGTDLTKEQHETIKKTVQSQTHK